MLDRNSTAFLLVDVQGNLAQAMHEKDQLFSNLQKLISGVRALGLPIVWAEQNPPRLGPTIPELQPLLSGLSPAAKMAFSCCGDDKLFAAIAATGRRHLLVAGIEAHVCVYQTVRDLLEHGYAVEVVADAVSSRTASNRDIGLQRMRELGARITSVEMALFELLRTATDPVFRDILRLVR